MKTTSQKVKSLMGNQQNVKFDNGVILQKTEYNAVLVGLVKDLELQWIENLDNLLPDAQKLIVRMLKARKTILSFDTEFRDLVPQTASMNVCDNATKGIVIDGKAKKEKK